MHLAKGCQRVGAKADDAGPAGMPPRRHLARDLHAGGGAEGGEDRLGIGLGVEDIDGAAAAIGVTRGAVADEEARRLQVLFARFAAVEGRADLAQRKVREAARLIAGGGAQEAGQQVGAQVGHFRRDGIIHPHRIGAAAEKRRSLVVDEAVGDAFVVAQRGQRAAGGFLALLQGRQDGQGDRNFWVSI